jgi:membrane protease YdiL (CAAX protease family)
MKTRKSFVQRYSALLYFVLTFAITWGCMALVAAPERFPISKQKLDELGPMAYVGMLIGPSLSGLLLTALDSGKQGFRDLWSRLSKWRVGIQWFAIALLATPLVALVILMALSLVSPEFVPGIFTSKDKTTLVMTGIIMGLFVGLFEEIGWIGFIVPRMRRRFSVLSTGIIVGVLWGAWHFPPFWEADTFSGAFPFFLLIIRLFAWLPPYRVLMVWFYERTGSLFLTILFHASLDFTMLVLPSATLTGWPLITWILVWSASLWATVVILSKDGKVPQRNLAGNEYVIPEKPSTNF